jgi:HK97 gp10 family phage protein
MTIRNRDKLRIRFKSITSPASTAKLQRALFAAGQLIENEAALSITRGSVSGAGHVASLPNQPPNADSHRLDRSIETNETGRLEVTVSANAEYAVPLEFGSSKMAPRPYLRPARDKKRKEVTALVARAVDHILRGN